MEVWIEDLCIETLDLDGVGEENVRWEISHFCRCSNCREEIYHVQVKGVFYKGCVVKDQCSGAETMTTSTPTTETRRGDG